MTNREIAAALYVSPKTVEANLSRVLPHARHPIPAELGRWYAEQHEQTEQREE